MDHLAAHRWHDPESSNCTVVVPVPCRGNVHRITLRLHKQYLSARSLLFRGLFSGASPDDLFHASRSSVPHTPHARLPRILPSPPSHPVIFLPVPDPSSIQPLFHWIYFGDTDHIQLALERGDVRWDGLAQNVEYLGLPIEIKVFLGRLYRLWHLPGGCPPARCSPYLADEDEDWDESKSEPESDGTQEDDTECDDRCRGRTTDIKPLIQLCGRLRVCTT